MIKVSFLGDSITDGCGASDREKSGYVNVLAKMYPLIAKKYAVGGANISRNNGIHNPYNFIDRAKKMDNDTDFVFVMGGTNDFGHGLTPIGNKYSKDEYTFYGACHSLMKLLIQKFSNEKLCFIIPLPRLDENLVEFKDASRINRKAPLSEFRKIIKELADSYHIRTLDISNDFNDVNKLTDDGLHPNDLGHEVIARALMKYLKNLGF